MKNLMPESSVIHKIALSALLVVWLSGCDGDSNQPLEAEDLTSLGVLEAAHKIHNNEITSIQLVEALISKIEQRTDLNAFITFDAERAKGLARAADQRKTGKLRGVPLVVKDNIEVAGIQHTAGTPGLLGYIPSNHAAVVAALEAEGAVILGKTNMHELAFGITSNNRHFGAPRNPHQPTHIAGGSSGGTAVAVAANMAPAGLGTDTGGSARIPAALTGIQGFRPTTGRYSIAGVTPISTTRDTVGIMARSVADIMLLDSVMAAATAHFDSMPANTIRLGVPDHYFYDNLEAGVRSVTDQALSKLEQAGIRLIPITITDKLQKLNDAIGFPIVLYEAKPSLDSYLRKRTNAYVSYNDLVARIASPDVAATFSQAVGTIGIDAYTHAVEVARPALQKYYAGLFHDNGIDGLIFPTTPLTARPIAGSDDTVRLNSADVNTFLTYIRNTDPSSNAGLPSISIHSGDVSGLPVGIQIDAPANSDAKLLSIARTIERILQP